MTAIASVSSGGAVASDRHRRSHSHHHHHHEGHASHRVPWLRAAVLGANDGLLSTSSLLVGIAAASGSRSIMLASGAAALVSGATSMAIGEYSSVSSQRDAEAADLAIEADELRASPRAELQELAGIYEQRGVPGPLALEVARALTDHDALDAHAREELGIDPDNLARPLQAATTSAISFAVGALVPILMVVAVAASRWVPAIAAACLVGLAVLGAVGARLGGASVPRAAARVLLGGSAAMAFTWVVGNLFDVAMH